MSYRELLVYTGTGELAGRMSDYAARLASIVKARLAAVIIETDVTDFSEFDRAILDWNGKQLSICWSSDDPSCTTRRFTPV